MTLEQLAQDLVSRAIERGVRLTFAESCTGGMLAKLVTDVPGSSACFEYGFVVYSNAAKSDLLQVPEQVIAEHGAVSEPTVLGMACGALARSGADIAAAVSGVAGPDGGTVVNPVGSVWFAFADAHGVQAEHRLFEGTRDAVRRQSAELVLARLRKRLQQ